MLRTLFLALLLFSAAGATPLRPTQPAPCVVRFVLEVLPRQLSASGYCRSLLDQPAHYYYQLVSERWGHSRAISTQSGSFELGPHQEAEVAQAQVRAVPGDHCRLRLRIYNEANQLIAQDSVRHDP